MTSAAHSLQDYAQAVIDKMRGQLAAVQGSREFREAVRDKILECGRGNTDLHKHQLRVLDDSSRRLLLCCSRRAGKSELLVRIIAATLVDCEHGEWVVFGARTLGIAKDLIWADLVSINEMYCLGWHINSAELSISTPNGGRFRLFGVDDRKSVDKVRGKKYRLVICDEASTYEEYLSELVVKAFGPGTVDIDGRIILSGTPGYLPSGFWFDASHGKLGAWSVHYWTMFDNPYMGDVTRKLREIREENGWDEEHPTYTTEYLGRWGNNATLSVCQFSDLLNVVDVMPEGYSRTTWRHVIGIDFGSVDACSWQVIAVDPYSADRYVVHDYAQSGLVGDAPVQITRELVEAFDTTYVVCDPGGGGKFFFETFNAQHGGSLRCHIRAANKQDLLGSIRLLNGELRTGRLKFLRSETAGVVGDIRRLLWKDERREKIVEGRSFPQDRFDALRYGLLETVAWASKERPLSVQSDPAVIAADMARLERAKRAEKKSARTWFDRR